MSWSWRAGMLTKDGWRVTDASDPGALRASREGEFCLDPGSYSPDLTDPSTLRGLLEVVRGAYVGVVDYIEVRRIARDNFAVFALTFGPTGEPEALQLGSGKSEAEALLDVCAKAFDGWHFEDAVT